jgi:hypothetical protein
MSSSSIDSCKYDKCDKNKCLRKINKKIQILKKEIQNLMYNTQDITYDYNTKTTKILNNESVSNVLTVGSNNSIVLNDTLPSNTTGLSILNNNNSCNLQTNNLPLNLNTDDNDVNICSVGNNTNVNSYLNVIGDTTNGTTTNTVVNNTYGNEYFSTLNGTNLYGVLLNSNTVNNNNGALCLYYNQLNNYSVIQSIGLNNTSTDIQFNSNVQFNNNVKINTLSSNSSNYIPLLNAYVTFYYNLVSASIVIVNSSNVSNVSRNGTGMYTVNLINTSTNSNYTVNYTGSNGSSNSDIIFANIYNKNLSFFNISSTTLATVASGNTTNVDITGYINISVFW